jgi:hypothetical protein
LRSSPAGVFVEGLLEAVLDQSPAGEDEPIGPADPLEMFAVPLQIFLRYFGDGGEPSRIVGQGTLWRLRGTS